MEGQTEEQKDGQTLFYRFNKYKYRILSFKSQ